VDLAVAAIQTRDDRQPAHRETAAPAPRATLSEPATAPPSPAVPPAAPRRLSLGPLLRSPGPPGARRPVLSGIGHSRPVDPLPRHPEFSRRR
jgi:hypothetical protein